MALSQMQDIGGCRAVVGTVRHVHRLVQLHEDSVAKNPNVRAEFVKKYDYIAAPKSDGYRSIHFVYKYCAFQAS
jgi:ppGpp synthetase/RelA/SpoT-type nucleotidyltranferase